MTNKDIIDQYQTAIIQIATQGGTGTGFYLRDYDLIVTNNHVVEGYAEVTIAGKQFEKALSRVWYTDRKHDLAFCNHQLLMKRLISNSALMIS